jgi:hypothetical protein
MQAAVDFGLGILSGGLVLSMGWGLFWLIVGTVGLVRRTCRVHVVLNSLVVGLVPFCMIWALLWARGSMQGNSQPFAAGLAIMPLALAGLALRRAPDGQRAGIHMVEGVRHLMNELLGRHHGCGGCSHETGHDHGGGG